VQALVLVLVAALAVAVVLVAAAVAALAAAAGATLAAAARLETGENGDVFMLNKLNTIFKHLWLDASDANRAIPPDMLTRLAKRVTASEARHTGEIRIYVEAALPMSYLWRLSQHSAMKALIRQRAVMLFGKLRVWDTQHNNGVLIYLQLAERAIEIVADRGLSAHVPDAEWQAMVARMRGSFQQGRYEDGLTQALGEVSALLVAHFPSAEGQLRTNELPDSPVLN
jgi:uncharacterized membrane protein